MSVNNLGEGELHLKLEIDISIPGARQLQNIRQKMINNTMGWLQNLQDGELRVMFTPSL